MTKGIRLLIFLKEWCWLKPVWMMLRGFRRVTLKLSEPDGSTRVYCGYVTTEELSDINGTIKKLREKANG